MTGYILSPAARADIGQIWDYTAERWGEEQAERYVLAIRDACQELAEGTRRSRAADEIIGMLRDVWVRPDRYELLRCST